MLITFDARTHDYTSCLEVCQEANLKEDFMAWVTVIVGPRGSGKTTIARGLVLLNRRRDLRTRVIEEYENESAFVIDDSEKVFDSWWTGGKKEVALSSLHMKAERDGFAHVVITTQELNQMLELIATSILHVDNKLAKHQRDFNY